MVARRLSCGARAGGAIDFDSRPSPTSLPAVDDGNARLGRAAHDALWPTSAALLGLRSRRRLLRAPGGLAVSPMESPKPRDSAASTQGLIYLWPPLETLRQRREFLAKGRGRFKLDGETHESILKRSRGLERCDKLAQTFAECRAKVIELLI